MRQLDELTLGPLLDELADRVAGRVLAQLEAREVEPVADQWRLLDVEETAARLGRSTRWVRERAKRGDLPHVRLDGGRLAFDLEDVRAFAHARRIPSGEPAPRPSLVALNGAGRGWWEA